MRKNIGSRNHNKGKKIGASPLRGRKGKIKIGLYHEREEEFKKCIIEQYLPLILSGEITLKSVKQELSTSYVTIDKIIEEFYNKKNDMDGLEQYRNAKRGHIGSIQRKEAKRKREEVANDKVVTKAEFVFLTAERQEEELIKKIRTEKLKEELSEKSKRKTALTSEEYVKEKINVIIKYFRSKNDSDSKEIYFSDTEIRLMIFSYPTLINRTPEILDNKLNVITSYEEIDERTAYGMIKEFPAIMGFDTSRTKKQLDLLKRECLIDAPKRLMYSVNFMYAQIQYAKERHHVLDLSAITRSIYLCVILL